ncbi:MAG TPA: HAD domain-containing protein [Solirubrobacteraceae bacterium]
MAPPLLLIDIDGVISLFGFDPAQPPPGRFLLVDGMPHFLSAAAAALVTELRDDFELVWCSGWEEKADEYLPLVLGLPGGLRHLTFDGDGLDAASADAARSDTTPRRHWKLAAIDHFAGRRRPLAWIDDGFDDSCHRWARSRPGPTELVATEPAVGLTDAHAAQLRRWAQSLRAGGGQ